MKLPTPQAGCFAATYPNPVWQQTQCSARPSEQEIVGNGDDEVANSSGTLIGGVLAGFTSVSGVKSEVDSKKGPNFYSLQINTNPHFPVEYNGKSTRGWEQFIYSSNGHSGECGTTTCGLILIEYWLDDYNKTYGSCPSGWGGGTKSCVFNSEGTLTESVPPANLSGLRMSAYANSVYSGPVDAIYLCVPPIEGLAGKCYALSVTDTVLNLYENWHQAEFNIFGINGRDRAIFNSGVNMSVANILEDHLGGAFGTVPCVNEGFTGETNNLNLDSCGPATVTEVNSFCGCLSAGTASVTGIVFTESD